MLCKRCRTRVALLRIGLFSGPHALLCKARWGEECHSDSGCIEDNIQAWSQTSP